VGNLWLRIKVSTKLTIVLAVVVYAGLFVFQNSARKVTMWYWLGREPETSVLVLVLCAFLLGVLVAILFRTTMKTVRQLRHLAERTRAQRLEREVAEMKTKAAMLRSRAAPGALGNDAAAEADIP
jgi:uncharacterized membrane protein YciS (DUF1049 family)